MRCRPLTVQKNLRDYSAAASSTASATSSAASAVASAAPSTASATSAVASSATASASAAIDSAVASAASSACSEQAARPRAEPAIAAARMILRIGINPLKQRVKCMGYLIIPCTKAAQIWLASAWLNNGGFVTMQADSINMAIFLPQFAVLAAVLIAGARPEFTSGNRLTSTATHC